MASPAQISTDNGQGEKYDPDSDHRAECKEYERHVRSVPRRNLLEASHFPVPTVRQDEAAQIRNIDGPQVGLLFLIRQSEQGKRNSPSGVPTSLHGGQLDRLVPARVEPVLVAQDHLKR